MQANQFVIGLTEGNLTYLRNCTLERSIKYVRRTVVTTLSYWAGRVERITVETRSSSSKHQQHELQAQGNENEVYSRVKEPLAAPKGLNPLENIVKFGSGLSPFVRLLRFRHLDN